MTSELCLPDEAVPYVLFQRTGYLRFPRMKAWRVLEPVLPASAFTAMVRAEARVSRGRVKSEYATDLYSEYESIKKHLPTGCRAILDIGCGVAGLDVYLAKHYLPVEPSFVLLDKSRVESSVFYGFESRAAFYNSLDVAVDVLVANGVDGSRVLTLEATDDNDILVEPRSIDLVVSLISWGFHYPVETYVDRVFDVLRPGGTAILDVRKNTTGVQELTQRFEALDVIIDDRKFQRVRVIRP